MEKIKLAIAIPTFNRLQNLQVLLETIDSQEYSENLELSLFISNIASTDGTSEFLRIESEKRNNLKIYNQVQDQTIKSNKYYLNKIISTNVDWVWFMGDDDKLSTKNSIQKVYECLKNNYDSNLEFIHVCETNRSKNTLKIFKDNVFKLCNKFGYHEMLGWISSIILKRETFNKVFDDFTKLNKFHYNDLNDSIVSAYPHSASILKFTHNKLGIFMDNGLVEPQNSVQTQDTIHRWADENMLWRYFHVIDDIENLINNKILPENSLNLSFFRYHTFYLWDHLIYLTFKRLPSAIKSSNNLEKINNQIQLLSTNLNRLLKAQNFLKDTKDKKNLILILSMSINYLKLYVSNNFSEEIRLNLFETLTSLIAIPIFPKQIHIE